MSLQHYVLDGVENTQKKLGTVVTELKFKGLKCAGKRLPDIVFQLATAQERATIIRQCEAECALLARLRHPNIVQFLGVHYDKGSDVPTLVMECMHTTLNACINCYGVLPDEVAYSILHDIALAIAYLHGNSPPIIHCNLNCANILLSTDMRAKISDFAGSITLGSKCVSCPGMSNYMPPEAFNSKPKYDTSLDIFSYGTIILAIFSGETQLTGPLGDLKLGRDHPLCALTIQCRDKDPKRRPKAADVVGRLDDVKSRIPICFEDRVHVLKKDEVAELGRESGRVKLDHLGGREKVRLEEERENFQGRVSRLEKQPEEAALMAQRQLQQRLEVQRSQDSTRDIDFWRVLPQEVVIMEGESHVLGRGAWGFVAEGKFRGKKVAVKCLHQAILDPLTIQRVHREIRTMAQTRHPNLVLFIAAVYEHGSAPMIITELLSINLRNAYERKLLGSSRLSIFHDVACALNYLHQHREPIIHRDVSAPNVLLEALAGGKWKAKVSDFGSANVARVSKTLGEGAIIYASPETIPQPYNLDAPPLPQTTKIDVYSYGILLCEVITSQLPDPAEYRTMVQQVQSSWPLMYDIITSCTKYHPDERPTMTQILDRIPLP